MDGTARHFKNDMAIAIPSVPAKLLFVVLFLEYIISNIRVVSNYFCHSK